MNIHKFDLFIQLIRNVKQHHEHSMETNWKRFAGVLQAPQTIISSIHWISNLDTQIYRVAIENEVDLLGNTLYEVHHYI